MTPSEDLFDLIQSLSMSEKRYFKIFASKHVIGKQNVYSILFDAIEVQREYDEKAIKKQFAKESFIKRLPALKNYLLHIILKSLRVYHSNESSSLRIKELLEHVEILYEKGLYPLCKKTLAKAKCLASQYEMTAQIMECLKWEGDLLVAKGTVAERKSTNIDIYKEQQRSIDEYKNSIEYRFLNSKAFSLLLNEGNLNRSADFKKKFKSILNHPLLRSDKQALSFQAKNSFYNTYSFYYRGIGELKKSYTARKKQMELWESNPMMIEQNEKSYVSAFANFINIHLELKKYDEALLLLHKVRGIVYKSLPVRIKVFSFSHILELNIVNEKGSFENGLKLAREIEAGLEKYKKNISKLDEVDLLYNSAISYFGAAQFGKSLVCLNKVVNDKKTETTHVHCFARILNLIVHFEKGNDETLKHVASSTHRFLKKTKRAYQFETLMLHFAKKISSSFPRKDLISEFKEFRKKLIELKNDPYERKVFEYFAYIEWVDSKIENKPFAEVVRSKGRKV